jgi:uncharacterized protein (DUF2236 family)
MTATEVRLLVGGDKIGGDSGLFGPESVTWRVHGHRATLIGGMRALLVQALHPLAMAGVAEHSDYRSDPWGRLRRTSEFMMVATYGTSAAAEAFGARVQAVHAHVQGVDPLTGRHYRAGDPELLAWVHNVLAHSLLLAKRRYGGGIAQEDANRYLVEMVRMAELVGTPRDLVPTTTSDLRDYLRGVEGLVASPVAKQAARIILAPPLPLAIRPLWAIPAAAAVGLVPARLRAMYGFPWFAPADPAVRAGMTALFGVLGAVSPGGPPAQRAAEARLAA